jgi:hypothetical protein
MKEKLIKLFDELNTENQTQLLDYAMMLWEMEQGENQIKENLGLGGLKEELLKNFPPNNDPKAIN